MTLKTQVQCRRADAPPEVYRTVTQQAAMTIRELTDLVDANGLHAAITIAVGTRNSAAVATGCLVGFYESRW